MASENLATFGQSASYFFASRTFRPNTEIPLLRSSRRSSRRRIKPHGSPKPRLRKAVLVVEFEQGDAFAVTEDAEEFGRLAERRPGSLRIEEVLRRDALPRVARHRQKVGGRSMPNRSFGRTCTARRLGAGGQTIRSSRAMKSANMVLPLELPVQPILLVVDFEELHPFALADRVVAEGHCSRSSPSRWPPFDTPRRPCRWCCVRTA